MKLNADKCHLLVSGPKYEHSWAKIGDYKFWESNKVKLLNVTIDNELKFDSLKISYSKYLLQCESKTKCIK